MHSLIPWFWVSVAGATDWVGSDLGGADLVLADGDTVAGTFVGVGRLVVPFGVRVAAVDLEVDAVEIVVDGTLTADGAGEPGGDTQPGAGPGAGGSAGGGGGGGGYGGPGGAGALPDGSPGAAGGAPYGDPAAPEATKGSGGGGGGVAEGPGGPGGGAIVLRASLRIDLGGTGRVSADGGPGDAGCFGGGGGSGGSITLEAPTLALYGALSARGGDGGEVGECYFFFGGAPGGGGGGGRIRTGIVTGGVVVDVAGGDGGDAGPLVGGAGGPGTWVEGDPPAACPDGDEDGVCEGDDCDDADATSFPGAPERCDGADNACAGAVPADELDGDGDGAPPCGGDCDDADPLRGPAATEACNGIDDDCDGVIDPGCPGDSAADTGGAPPPADDGCTGCRTAPAPGGAALVAVGAAVAFARRIRERRGTAPASGAGARSARAAWDRGPSA